MILYNLKWVIKSVFIFKYCMLSSMASTTTREMMNEAWGETIEPQGQTTKTCQT